MVRDNGVKTYFASDIAFILNKRERGFEHLLYVWGADHHGYIVRLRAGLEALGGPPECFEVRLVQVVSLFRGGEKAKMSKRSGELRHAARTARGGRQRCGAPVLRHAQQRPASGFRFGAGEGTLQRQPGVLHSVCARARRERAAATSGARRRPRCRARRCLLGRLIEPQEVQLIKRLATFPESFNNAPYSARRTPWCTTCATSRTTFTPTTARINSSSTMRAARRALESRAGDSDRHPQRPRTVGRIRARHHVTARQVARDYKSKRARHRAASRAGWASLPVLA
jgi:hypothetical protein